MTVFDAQTERSDRNVVILVDVIEPYRAGRYINSNKAAWQIPSFTKHERSMAAVYFAVHLENEQYAYYTVAYAQQIALNPLTKTLTDVLTLCQIDAFAITLLYSEVPTYCRWNVNRKSFSLRQTRRGN